MATSDHCMGGGMGVFNGKRDLGENSDVFCQEVVS